MTRAKAIAIAAIATLIFGSLAVGIAANTGNGGSTTEVAVDSLTAPTTAPAQTLPGDTTQPVQQPVLVDLTDDDRDEHEDEDDNSGRGSHDDDERDDDHRGRDHAEDD